MRRRMAYRKRKALLRKGVKITAEGCLNDNGDYVPHSKSGYCVELKHCGWKISSADEDMLSAYNGAMFAVKCAEEKPRKEVEE